MAGYPQVNPHANLTLRQYQALEAIARKDGKTVDAMLQAAMDKQLSELLAK